MMTSAIRFGLALAALFSAFAPLHADEPAKTFPRQILLIRHGEKPPDEAMLIGLSAKGKERADALYRLFETSETRPTPFAKPDFIFAASNSKNSHRPVETVKPLAKRLKLPINSEFGNDTFDLLARELFRNPKYAGKTVLICWRHGSTPDLAANLKVAKRPLHWSDGTFDRVWQITFNNDGKAEFRDLPQQLLPKDAAK